MDALFLERFWARVDKTDTCWVWVGHVGDDGYGKVSVKRRTQRAHRVAYELLVGPIPRGLQIDHLCRNRACVNPDHLEPVTQEENVRRGNADYNHLKTHCPQGHPYDETNTILKPGRHRPRRCCRACTRAAWRKYAAKRRAARRALALAEDGAR